MEIEERAPGTLTPYPDNPRRIPEAAVDAVARSIAQYGFRQPIVVDAAGVVIVGHTRLQAALKMGLATVPVHVADLTTEQARAYRLADNRTGEIATWDKEKLSIELAALAAEADADLAALHDLTGFLPWNLRALLPETKDPDAPVPIPKKPKTKRGDIWTMGRHRLLCGDATDEEDVGRLLDGGPPRLMVTDPPYAVDYDSSWRQDALGTANRRVDDVPGDAVGGNLLTAALRCFAPEVLYAWHAGKLPITEAVQGMGYEVRAQIVWVKQLAAISRGHYHWQHEPCVYAVRKGAKAGWIGDRKQTTVWEILNAVGSLAHGEGSTHSTSKPMECMERPIRHHSGDVYDPFVGSGTTVIAAERQDRACWAMEIDPRYCDATVRRWEEYTGEKATRG